MPRKQRPDGTAADSAKRLASAAGSATDRARPGRPIPRVDDGQPQRKVRMAPEWGPEPRAPIQELPAVGYGGLGCGERWGEERIAARLGTSSPMRCSPAIRGFLVAADVE
jgi:hypothetical protein